MLNMGSGQFLFLLFLCFCLLSFTSSIPHACRKDQSTALLKFKKTLTVEPPLVTCRSYSYMKSWNRSRDCCSWDGVICDEMTGHVTELDLCCCGLVGKIDSNSSLFQLSHLQRLDLSANNFSNSHISPEFGKFSSLTHLDLSESNFSGQIPSEISHLSKLQFLYLSGEMLKFGPHDFELLLQNLTQLRELHLSGINISSTFPLNFSSHLTTLYLRETGLYGIIPETIFHLPNLETLQLTDNYYLSGYFPKTKWNSSASLIELDLRSMIFSDNLPESMGYLTSLQLLSLIHCNLRGPIPESLLNLTRLKTLDLSYNSLNGTIPPGMFSLPSLSYLQLNNNHFSGLLEDFKSNSLTDILLESNQLQGHLPNSIQNLVNLQYLGLSFNNFSGRVDVSFFSDLKQLSHLSLSYNSISLTNENKVNFTLPESLNELQLAACEVKELEFLRSANQLEDLDLSNNKIEGRIPDWAWSNWNFSMSYLNISHNMLMSVDLTPLQSLYTIDLRSNLLQGSLPIPPISTTYFFISHNNLTEEIPSSICNLTSLVILDLAKNNLKGAIPQCLGNISGLEVLDMHNNKLSGTLPTIFSNGSSLRSLNLHGNKLEGEIPQSLANCKDLQLLDLGDNNLNGTFPLWLGTFPKLQILNLRVNKFHGPIRTARIENMFPELRVIDLSYNAFTGDLPMSLFQHLKAMRTIDEIMRKDVRILIAETIIDLSSNRFEGRIPNIVGDLIALRALNLSHNELQGRIPSSLGNLSVVESLDLSGNQLSGEIPEQLASFPFLVYFLISENNLTGEIPLSICNLMALQILNLARNNLMGVIPQCLGNISGLEVLDMHRNNLSGTLPTTFGIGSTLRSFNFHGNKLEGKIPQSLTNCKQLEVLDLGGNHLNDTFPMWLGTLPKLKVLSLRSNKLHGSIRTLTTENMFPQLRIFDLSSNAFTGNLPMSLFQHLKAMRTIDPSNKAPSYGYYQDSVVVVTKGLELEVERILFLYTTMDLSNNNFEGHIPGVIGDLVAIRVLNFSHNRLQGHIPSSLGNLSVVESLDLSSNQLTREIPEQLASITSLAVLNLSHNHLEGCIPKGPQFATFEKNSYEGNDGLRGYPFPQGCGSSRMPETENTTQMLDEVSKSTFLSEFWNGILMGYGSGLIIGCSIAYFMLSSRNSNWLSRIAEELEYRIVMRRRKKKQGHHRR